MIAGQVRIRVSNQSSLWCQVSWSFSGSFLPKPLDRLTGWQQVDNLCSKFGLNSRDILWPCLVVETVEIVEALWASSLCWSVLVSSAPNKTAKTDAWRLWEFQDLYQWKSRKCKEQVWRGCWDKGPKWLKHTKNAIVALATRHKLSLSIPAQTFIVTQWWWLLCWCNSWRDPSLSGDMGVS